MACAVSVLRAFLGSDPEITGTGINNDIKMLRWVSDVDGSCELIVLLVLEWDVNESQG